MEAEISIAAAFSAVCPILFTSTRIPNPPERTNGVKEIAIFHAFGSISQLCAVSRMIPPQIISTPMIEMLHSSQFRAGTASRRFR